MGSLLSGLTARDIRLSPFPHLVVSDALEPALYEELAASFPSIDRVAGHMQPGRVPDNRRFALPAHLILDAPDLPECWKRFVGLHSGPEFFAEVTELFGGHWPAALLAAVGGQLAGHPMNRLRLWDPPQPDRLHISQDARIEINTPVRQRPSCVRGPHLDTPNRLYSGLFYMRAPDDDSVGGDLLLYRWRGKPRVNFAAYEQPADAVEEAVRIPYRANQLVLFPHCIDALHGPAVRHPTPHVRRYVFITAELNRDWLSAPDAGGAA